MNEAHDPDRTVTVPPIPVGNELHDLARTVDVPSVPADSLDPAWQRMRKDSHTSPTWGLPGGSRATAPTAPNTSALVESRREQGRPCARERVK